MLTLSADDSQNLHWRIDAELGVHSGMKIHTGGKFSMGYGAAPLRSTKQKVILRSSIEEELIAVDDKISKAI